MVKKVIKFFDKLEDRTRGFLSHYPIVYGFLGGIGIVLFWRGVWHTADVISLAFLAEEPISTFAVLDGPISIFVGSIILLLTGVFVSEFIGNKIIISGLVGGKKLSEMQKEEIETEEAQLENIESTLVRMEKKISELEETIEKKNE
jgi:hypothetical protein